MTIGDLSRRTGVTIRALRHYDRIGLLRPTRVTEAGYRLYDESAIERLHMIRLYRELEFPLAEIRSILDSPDFHPIAALDDQIALLTLRRDRLDGLIRLARRFKEKGAFTMSFDAYDDARIHEYTEKARASWGHTDAWQEYEQKEKRRRPQDSSMYGQILMEMIGEFGSARPDSPDSDEAQRFVQRLRDFISAHFYTCTVPVLRGLADMYDAGGDFTGNIDRAGGEGTAHLLAQAMRIYCSRHDSD